eukprot:6617326-Alexandrium_andersonii.AAC.1
MAATRKRPRRNSPGAGGRRAESPSARGGCGRRCPREAAARQRADRPAIIAPAVPAPVGRPRG